MLGFKASVYPITEGIMVQKRKEQMETRREQIEKRIENP